MRLWLLQYRLARLLPHPKQRLSCIVSRTSACHRSSRHGPGKLPRPRGQQKSCPLIQSVPVTLQSTFADNGTNFFFFLLKKKILALCCLTQYTQLGMQPASDANIFHLRVCLQYRIGAPLDLGLFSGKAPRKKKTNERNNKAFIKS